MSQSNPADQIVALLAYKRLTEAEIKQHLGTDTKTTRRLLYRLMASGRVRRTPGLGRQPALYRKTAAVPPAPSTPMRSITA